MLLAEAKSEQSSLWIVTRGSVELSESGQVLCMVETGGIFGDSVALGRCDQQPFSVKAVSLPVIAWCLPAAELRQASGPFMSLNGLVNCTSCDKFI